jgi:GT2 family glycosyltransferase
MSLPVEPDADKPCCMPSGHVRLRNVTGVKQTVSVVIPTNNRPKQLSRLLESLREASGIAQIVVVDDGSHPPVNLRERSVEVIRHERPRLLAAARNIGAENSSGDVLVFVDDDCVFAPDALRSLVRAVTSDDSVGIIGPVIAYLGSPATIWCAGGQHGKWTGLTKLRANGAHVRTAKRLPSECDDFPCAFAMRRAVFDEVGGFDERFAFHMTEGDIAERVSARGYRVALAAEAVIWHDFAFRPDAPFIRRIMAPQSPERAFVVARDRVRFIRRHRIPWVRRASQLSFYMLGLVPAYGVAIMLDCERPMRQRLLTLRSFLLGNWTALMESRPRIPR